MNSKWGDPAHEFTYEVLPSGIHQLTLYTYSPKAIEETYSHLDTIFRQATPDQPLRFLTIFEHPNVPPLNELWKRSRALFERYPVLPPIRSTALYSDDLSRESFVLLHNIMAETLGADIQIYTMSEREVAVNWLLEEKS